MTDASVYLVVTSTPNPGKEEQIQDYVSQVTPILVRAGGEPVGRYAAIEQLGGDGGPKAMSAMKFPSTEAIKAAFATDEFKALAVLRDDAFSRVDQMICAAF